MDYVPASPLLDPGEPVVKRGIATHYYDTPTGLGYNPVRGDLLLSTRRIVFEPKEAIRTGVGAMNFPALVFPLSRITRIGQERRRVGRSAYPLFPKRETLIRLEFDNGGRELFFVETVSDWEMAITQAQAQAPDLPYVIMPSTRRGVENSSWFTPLVTIISLAILGACCGCFVLTYASGGFN